MQLSCPRVMMQPPHHRRTRTRRCKPSLSSLACLLPMFTWQGRRTAKPCIFSTRAHTHTPNKFGPTRNSQYQFSPRFLATITKLHGPQIHNPHEVSFSFLLLKATQTNPSPSPPPPPPPPPAPAPPPSSSPLQKPGFPARRTRIKSTCCKVKSPASQRSK